MFIGAEPMHGLSRAVNQAHRTAGGAGSNPSTRTSVVVWLLIVYAKAKFDNLPASFLAQLNKGVEDAI